MKASRRRDPVNDSTLSDGQQTVLSELLDRYLRNLEQGIRLESSELTADHPELADTIGHYIAEIDLLYGLVAEPDESETEGKATAGQFRGTFSLGEYTILRELGRGGMGTVYEAHDNELQRRVAVKILSVAATLDQRQITRFKNESQAAGQLHHPNIVPIFSIGCEHRVHFYVMQLIEGKSIDQWIDEQRDPTVERESWRAAVHWAIAIADALHCAHESGIVHRDVKPSNLMLDRNGKIWITDFGLARFQKELTITRTGEIVGTMRYMSPEQASAGIVDHRTDIYSLAASLFEMLTLRAAIEGDDSAALLRKIADDDPPQLRHHRRDLPTDLSVVLRKAMSNRKDDRYRSAQQFAADLQAVLEGRPTIARPPSIASLAGRWALRHRKAVTVAACGLIVALIGLSAGSGIISQKSREVRHQETRADHYFSRAHRTVNQFGTNIAEQLAAVPGTEQIRRRLLKDTLEYYQQFVAEAVGDATLQTEIATTHSRIADLVNELDGPAEAIPHYRDACEVFSALPAADAGLPETQRRIAENLNNLGMALASTSDVDSALTAYRQAESIQTRLLDSHPDNARFAIELAVTENNIGLLFRRLNQTEQARDQFTKSAARLRQVIDSPNSSVFAERSLAVALANLSSTMIDKDPIASAELLQQAIDQRLDTSKRTPNRLNSSAEIATLYNDLGSVYLRLDQPANAEQALAGAIRIGRQLAMIAPLVGEHRRNLAISLNNIAMAKQKQSQQAGAADHLREAISLLSELTDVSKVNPSDLSRLGATEHNLAVLLAGRPSLQDRPSSRQDRNRQADALLKSAIQHQQLALQLAPKSPEMVNYLRNHYAALLRSQTRRGLTADVRATRVAIQESDIGEKLRHLDSEISDVSLDIHRPDSTLAGRP